MGTRRLVIELNHLPLYALSLNSRVHWSKRYSLSKKAGSEVANLVKSELSGWTCGEDPMDRARISLQFHTKGTRKHDYDNLLSACKAYFDGLVQAGVLVDDDVDHLEIGSMILYRDGRESTIIKVEELEE
jgi:Holliday junction resolvase RusA-like endonuclease